MVSPFSVLLIKIRIDNDFDFIVAVITEWMSIVLQGPVRSQSRALLGSNRGPDRSQKASEIKDRGPGPQKTAKNRS